jgi:FkbM family methyltransferase
MDSSRTFPRIIPAKIARPILAMGLRAMPYLFGVRGRRHAEWRADHWVPSRFADEHQSVSARRGGITWELDLRDNVQRSVYYLGSYEHWTSRLLNEEFGSGDVFADVGAHIGVHALPAARQLAGLGGRVFAFEPAQDSIAKLEVAAARAGLANFSVAQVAIGRSPGQMTLRASDPHTLSEGSMRSAYGSGDVIGAVPMVTFDEWAKDASLARLDVVKIDVEGAEYDVVHGMQHSLRSLQPRLVVIEVIDENLEVAGSSKAALMELMADCGYRAASEVTERNVSFRRQA